MDIEKDIRQAIAKAVSSGDTVARDVLRVALGQIQTESVSKALAEDLKIKIVKKIIKSNETTIEGMKQTPETEWTEEWKSNFSQLQHENEVLNSLLPLTWGFEETKNVLIPIVDKIIQAPAEGQALGIAFKQLKTTQAIVDNVVVKEVVQYFRKNGGSN